MPKGYKITFKEKIEFLTEIKSRVIILKSGSKTSELDTFICPACNRIFERTWHSIKDRKRCNCPNTGCENCTKREYFKTSTSIKEVRKDFLDRGFTPLFTEYKSCMDLLEYLCVCGNKSSIRYSRFKIKNRTCLCKECSLKVFPRGENHPSYNKNISDEHRKITQRRDNAVKRWYTEIFRRYNYTCVITGIRKGDISAHHLYSYADYPEKRLELENGVCIKKELHMEFHNKYGRGKNTPQQFVEYYKEKTGKDIAYRDISNE